MQRHMTRRRLVQAGGGLLAATAITGLPRSVTRAQNGEGGLDIVTTIGQIADPTANIIGDVGQVAALMGPGVDPHLYNPTAGDIGRLEGADVILYGGLHLEGRMGDTLEHLSSRGTTVLAVSETVEEDRWLSGEELDLAHDPHLWFDVLLWHDALSSIPSVLAELDSDNASTYEENWSAYSELLLELDAYVVEQAEIVPEDRRVLVTAHDAFGYFGERYGFDVRGIQGISTASEASASDIQDLADFLVEREIPAIFIESTVPTSTIEALQAAANSRGWTVDVGGELFSDAMGEDGTPEGTYEGMIRHNIDTIVAALT